MDRVSEENLRIAERLGRYAAATLHEVMGKRNDLRADIKPVWKGCKVCGPAFTVKVPDGDNLPIHLALAVAPANTVIVAETGNYVDGAIWGELNSVAAQARGILGLVTDGAVRDVENIEILGFPIFSPAIDMHGLSKDHAGEVDVPVTCGGVRIEPGDYVVGDADGVVAVPRGEVEDVMEAARQREEREAGIMEELRRGGLTIDLLGFRESLESKLGGKI
jgi:4-hydroxy-4-methyl-2-oxoglutarate aldolase